jgi:hypothetical protein
MCVAERWRVRRPSDEDVLSAAATTRAGRPIDEGVHNRVVKLGLTEWRRVGRPSGEVAPSRVTVRGATE